MTKKNKPLWRRIIGDWSSFKAGTMIGAGVRSKATSKITAKPERWLERKGKEKSAEWVAERRRKFKRNYIVATVSWVAAWVLLSYFVGIAWPVGTGTVAVTILLIAWQMYRAVVKRIEAGQKGKQ